MGGRGARRRSALPRATSTSSPTATGPDAYERTLPEVFPDFAPGNFTWDDDLDGWVWTTFNEFQWDLDWSNPDVFAEFADIVLFLANVGVDVLRLDAIAFVWKRLGTNCQNQPEVHSITQALRALIRIACPATVLKAEAIVAPDELVHYLGRGRHHGKVSDLAYHNTLMVQVWSMLATRDVRLAVHALQELPVVPSTTAWITYVRCHDDIGWAIDDGDAAAVGLDGFAHRAFLSDFYSGDVPRLVRARRGLPGQPGDRRPAHQRHRRRRSPDSTTPRSPEQVDAGDRARAARARDRARLGRRARCSGWATRSACPPTRDWAAEPGHEDDNRWLHRPRMDAASRRRSGMSTGTVPARLFAGLRAPRAGARRPAAPARRRSRRRCSTRPIPACCRCCAATPRASCSSCPTSPTVARPFPWHRVADLGWCAAHDMLTGATVAPAARTATSGSRRTRRSGS